MKKYRIRKGSLADKARKAGGVLVVGAMTFSLVLFAGCEYEKAARAETATEVEATTDNYTYGVPLASELQLFIANTCEDYDVDPALVIAMIGVESSYNSGAVGDGGNSVGLMQVQSKWHAERMARLGVTDLTNPYQNVIVGVDYIAEKLAIGSGVEWALMAYNGGNRYADKMAATGQVSDYALEVMAEAYKLTAERGEYGALQ